MESQIWTGLPLPPCPAGTSSARPEAALVRVYEPSPFWLALQCWFAPPLESQIAIRVPFPV